MLINKNSSIIKNVILGLIVCCLGFGGCASEQKLDVSSQQRKTKAIKAYNSALAAIMREPALTIDIIWALREILKLTPDETLQQFVNNKTASIKKHPSLRLIDPNAPLTHLPEAPSSGFARYSNYLLAPFGTPQARAVSFINDFLKTDETGYILTHQFFVIEWAEQTGLVLPKQIRDKKSNILERILREQLADGSFSDLYAERAAILLHFTKPKPQDAARWIDTIVTSQSENGNWPISESFLSYDGQLAKVTPPASHTTVLSLLALRVYINEY